MNPEIRSGSEEHDEVLQEGVLLKRSIGSVMGIHKWQKRYFVLSEGGSLRYYSLQDGNLRCEFVLDEKTIVKEIDSENCELEIQTPYVSLIVKAIDLSTRDLWKSAILCVIKDAKIRSRNVSVLRKRTLESRVPKLIGKTGRGTHMFIVGGTTFEVDTRYHLEAIIGRGARGVVVSARDAISGNYVAIKKIAGVFDNVTECKRILREVTLLRVLRHKNINCIIDLMRPSPVPGQKSCIFDDVYIVLDKMDTDLNRIIYSEQQLSDQHIQFLVYQLLSAIHYCGTANVVHRDLKPSNILVNAKCELRVCDFGLARNVVDAASDDLTTYVVTRWYRAPELILGCLRYTTSVDMWSVGCIFAELLMRKPLFPGESFLHQLQLICNVVGTPKAEDLEFLSEGSAHRHLKAMKRVSRRAWRDVPGLKDAPEAALDLLDKMLAFSPTKRISTHDALKHPYLEFYHNQPIKSAKKKCDVDMMEYANISMDELRYAMIQEIHMFSGDSDPRVE